MQAIMETLFDAVYLTLVIAIGLRMIRSSQGNRQFRLFGIMAVVLGAGDAFHLIPRRLPCAPRGWSITRLLWGWESGLPPSP